MPIKSTLSALVLLSLSAVASALDIKGIEVDKPVDCEQLKTVGIPAHGVGEPCDVAGSYIRLVSPFLTGSATLSLEISTDNHVKSVHASGFDYDQALTALTKKYGRPATRRSTVQNGFGARFPQALHTWSSKGVTLELSMHGANIGEPTMFLSGRLLDSEFTKKTKRSLGNI